MAGFLPSLGPLFHSLFYDMKYQRLVLHIIMFISNIILQFNILGALDWYWLALSRSGFPLDLSLALWITRICLALLSATL